MGCRSLCVLKNQSAQTGCFPHSQLHEWGAIHRLSRMSVIRGEVKDVDGVQVGTDGELYIAHQSRFADVPSMFCLGES